MPVQRSVISQIIIVLLCSIVIVSNALALNISGSLRGGDGNLIREQIRVGASSDMQNWSDVETGNGQYTIANLNPGVYWVRAEPVGINSWYPRTFYPATTNEDEAQMIFVFDQDAMGIDITMSEGGRFSGSITPDGGGQLPGDMAAILVSDNPQSFFDARFEFETDQASNYTSPIIPAGDYIVRFLPPPMNDHVPMYYGDALNPGNAAWVTIEPGATTANISAELPIGGRVTGSAMFGDEPMPGTIAIAIIVDNSEFYVFSYGGADQQANYTLYGLPAGQCYIQFMPPSEELCGQWYRQAYTFQDATPVQVQAEQVTENIDAEFERGAAINGTILNPDGSPVGQGMVNLELVGNSDLFAGNHGIEMTEDGVWRTPGTIPPGTYGVRVGWISEPNVAPQYYNNATHPWDADWMEMGAGVDTPPLVIHLQNGGTVSGYIEDAAHQRLSNIEVAVMDDYGEISGNRSDENGNFQFGNIPVGRYFLMATPPYDEGGIDPANAWVTTYSGNGFTRQGATRFDVTAEQNTEVNVTLGRGGVLHVIARGPGGRLYDMLQDGVGIMPMAFDNAGMPCWDAATPTGNDGPPSIPAEGSDIALPPGSYTVAGFPIFLGPDVAQAPNVRRTFLGGGFDLQGAVRINVVAGQSVEAVLDVVETGHAISGTARTAQGKPGQGVTAAVDGNGIIVNAYIPTFSGFADPNGSYMLKGMPNGSYRVLNWPSGDASYILATWYPNIGDPGRQVENLSIPNGAQQVAINNADVPNTNIALQLAAHYTGVEPEARFSVPAEFALHGAFPNPFNSSAVLFYSLNKSAEIKLSLTDILGREVALLSDGQHAAGMHSARINGEGLSNGVYFAKLETEGFKAITKVVLMK